MSQALPDVFACTDFALSEIVVARNSMLEQMARLDVQIANMTGARSQKQPAVLALAAEDVARTANQINILAASIHRGIAKRLNLESRV